MPRAHSLGYCTATVSATALAGGAVRDIIAEKPILAAYAAVNSLIVISGHIVRDDLKTRMRNYEAELQLQREVVSILLAT